MRPASLKADYEAQGAEVILADAGDYSQGTVYVSVHKGADAVAMMNATGYDVATISNHEFDYGYAQLAENMKAAKFKVLCADVLGADGKTIFDANTIIEKGGVKIGFIAALTGGAAAYGKSQEEGIRMAVEEINQKAAELLLEGNYNVSEVSYKVGINDPFYFSKCFKQILYPYQRYK